MKPKVISEARAHSEWIVPCRDLRRDPVQCEARIDDDASSSPARGGMRAGVPSGLGGDAHHADVFLASVHAPIGS